MAITVETRTDIIELIVGMVGAAPGATILSELADIVDAGTSLNDLAIALANNPAFKVLYPSFLTSEEFATNYLTQLLGSEVDATTLSTSIDAMVADLNSGTHRGAAMYTAITTLSATAETDANFGAAAAALNNKTEVAIHYSVTTQQSSDTLDDLVAVVSSVGSTQASVDAALAVVNGTDNIGQTFNLTSSADNLKGTGGNDTFVAVVDGTTATNTTLSAADTLNGADGTGDTLSIVLQGGATANVPAATSSNIESVEVRNVSAGATSLSASGFAGATSFVNDRSTADITVTNLGSAAITVVGNDVATIGNTTATGGTGATTLNIRDGVGAGNINITGSAVSGTSATINTSGGTATATTGANQVGTVTFAGGTLDTVTINAATSFVTTAAIAGWDTTGADANKGKLVINSSVLTSLTGTDAAVETIDASGSTGAVTVTASTQTDFVYTGGSGTDTVTTAATLATPGSVSGGDGSDKVIVVEGAHIDATSGKLYSGFETVEVGSAASTGAVTLSMLTLASTNTITAVRANPGAQAVTINSLNAAQAGAVTVTGGGHALTLGVTGASTVGQIDTVNLASSSSTTVRDVQAVGLAGVEKLVTSNITITALTSATALDSITISGAGAQSITSGAITPNVNTVVDGSAATGVLTLNFSGITVDDTNPMLIKGGAGADIISSSGETDDLVNGGVGIDTITVTDTGGATKWADVQSDATTSLDGDVIVGFVTAQNDFDYNGALSNGTGTGAGISAAEQNSSATAITAMATGDAANDIVFTITTAIAAGATDTAVTTFIATPTAANADLVEAAIVVTGQALAGTIANLDTVLGAGDSVLFNMNTNAGDSVLFRVTNTDTTVANTLTAAEIELVAVFDGTAAVAAGDIV
ncbi:MAG: hemolysin-type calcium-binding region [Pseudohongiella sp.]|nr:MAG: hemolysin-type calcium-binding region [Pseudohongiella sp.]